MMAVKKAARPIFEELTFVLREIAAPLSEDDLERAGVVLAVHYQ